MTRNEKRRIRCKEYYHANKDIDDTGLGYDDQTWEEYQWENADQLRDEARDAKEMEEQEK